MYSLTIFHDSIKEIDFRAYLVSILRHACSFAKPMLNVCTLHKLCKPKCFLFFQVNPFDSLHFFSAIHKKKVGVSLSWKCYYLKSHCEIALLHNGTKMSSIWSRICIVFIETYTLHYGQIHYIRVYEKSNFKSLIIGNLYVKLFTFLEKDPS